MYNSDNIQHYGVKGMKWGVKKARNIGSSVKTGLTKAGRKYNTSVERIREKNDKNAEAYHNKHKNNLLYKSSYNSHLRTSSYRKTDAKKQHLDSVRRARADMRMAQVTLMSLAMTPALTKSNGKKRVKDLLK